MALKLAIVQFRPHKGNYTTNLERISDICIQLAQSESIPDIVILPETALTGYFLEGGVREQAVTAGQLFADLERLYAAGLGRHAPPIDIVVGFYERWRGRFYNSVMYATLNAELSGNLVQEERPGIKHVHRKLFLPTYGVFDEARFVESGQTIQAFNTRLGRFAMLICEDAWHSLSGSIVAVDGADMLFIVSASPARGVQSDQPANLSRWDDRIREISGEHGMFVAVAQLVGFEGGKGFAGGSTVFSPRSEELARGPLWQETIVMADVDLDEIVLARADLPLLADLEERLPFLLENLDQARKSSIIKQPWDAPTETNHEQALTDSTARHRIIDSEGEKKPATFNRKTSNILSIQKAPAFDAASDAMLAINTNLVTEWLVEFLRDEVGGRRGFKQVVVGLSGGVDSALTTYLCARAFGPENVLAIRMPYRTSSQESLDHAQLVIDDLGIQHRTIEITNAVEGYLALEADADSRRRGNVMARMRMIVLFDQSQKMGCIPIGTGNKTERLFGYYTWHADDSPPVNPLGDLFKTQVWEVARAIGVPEVIIDKPASADLVVGQTDEADFGISYRKADRILAYLINGYRPEQLIERGFNPDDVTIVQRRVNSTHWKRHLPSTAMLSSSAIGEYYLRPVDY